MQHTKRRIDLWTVIDVLQRRLERQGLTAEVVDAAIARAIRDAFGEPASPRLAQA